MRRLAVSGLLVLFLVTPILVSPMSVRADTYTIIATSTSPALWTGFTLTYKDNDNDAPVALFDAAADTVVAFSGVVNSFDVLYTTVVGAPVFNAASSPFTEGTGAVDQSFPWAWQFQGSGGDMYAQDACWTYTQSPGSPVPLPASALLLGSGLIPLAWFRRRNRLGS